MLASAIIIFREVLEIVLIVGIVLAATRNLPGRMRWIFGGFAGGLAGAALVAVFTDTISNFAEGVGQELFNAGVLLVAALFIGWTVLWMSRHAHEMKGHFSSVGERIRQGSLPCYMLSLTIALAIWREGSEIVLFSYGMLAAGESAATLVGGAVIGGVAGLVVGLLMYFGLIALKPKYFFRVTSILLVLLVAGMVSQATQFLMAAGYLNVLSGTAWDSSWLLSEQNYLGQALSALIGYTPRPAQIQVALYLLTVLLLFGLMRAGNRRLTPVSSQAAV